jgi:hypothetical protein
VHTADLKAERKTLLSVVVSDVSKTLAPGTKSCKPREPAKTADGT